MKEFSLIEILVQLAFAFMFAVCSQFVIIQKNEKGMTLFMFFIGCFICVTAGMAQFMLCKWLHVESAYLTAFVTSISSFFGSSSLVFMGDMVRKWIGNKFGIEPTKPQETAIQQE